MFSSQIAAEIAYFKQASQTEERKQFIQDLNTFEAIINGNPAAITRLEQEPSENLATPLLFVLGKIYYFGQVVKQDKVKANEYLLKAAERGSPEASYLLGLLNEEGVIKDASRKGYNKALCALGKLYEAGNDDVAQNIEGAAYLYRTALENDDPEAMLLLKNLYVNNQQNPEILYHTAMCHAFFKSKDIFISETSSFNNRILHEFNKFVTFYPDQANRLVAHDSAWNKMSETADNYILLRIFKPQTLAPTNDTERAQTILRTINDDLLTQSEKLEEFIAFLSKIEKNKRLELLCMEMGPSMLNKRVGGPCFLVFADDIKYADEVINYVKMVFDLLEPSDRSKLLGSFFNIFTRPVLEICKLATDYMKQGQIVSSSQLTQICDLFKNNLKLEELYQVFQSKTNYGKILFELYLDAANSSKQPKIIATIENLHPQLCKDYYEKIDMQVVKNINVLKHYGEPDTEKLSYQDFSFDFNGERFLIFLSTLEENERLKYLLHRDIQNLNARNNFSAFLNTCGNIFVFLCNRLSYIEKVLTLLNKEDQEIFIQSCSNVIMEMLAALNSDRGIYDQSLTELQKTEFLCALDAILKQYQSSIKLEELGFNYYRESYEQLHKQSLFAQQQKNSTQILLSLFRPYMEDERKMDSSKP